MSDAPPRNSLRPRARLLKTLGQELISSEVVAVIELVKNAYDADATRVLIRFVPPLEPHKGCIEVIDNGHGMSLSIVTTVWMEPATISKRNQLRSEKFKRRYLGEKGIGRFAAARLADELEVISRCQGEDKEVFALFDWRQFEDEDRYLDEVEILWELRTPVEIPSGVSFKALCQGDAPPDRPTTSAHGTILRMAGLRQTWEGKHFQDLTRGLARLVSSRQTKVEQSGDFEISLDLPEEFSHLSNKIEPPPILRHPHYTVRGNVRNDGSYEVSYCILAEGVEKNVVGRYIRVPDGKGGFEFRSVDITVENRPMHWRPIECGPLEFELRVWDRDELGNVVQKTHSTIRDIRRDLDAVAGINIYRDGFRVLPYGEPQDDWLRLDLRRVQNPTLRLGHCQGSCRIC